MQTIAYSYRHGHFTVWAIVDHTCGALWGVLLQSTYEHLHARMNGRKLVEALVGLGTFQIVSVPSMGRILY